MSLKDGRCVARPLQNLGSTCFVNCVLQALAHAPELCMAVDTQPHSAVCPIAAENAAAAASASAASVILSNPSNSNGGNRASKRNGGAAPSSNSSAASSNSSTGSVHDPAVGTRRSSRVKAKGVSTASVATTAASGGRKSPASDQDSNRSSSNQNGRQQKYCVLCELERHFAAVHDATRRDKPLAPSTFVNGFFEHVAPWFKLGVQEDAHEFLRLLIDATQKSCQQARLQINPQDDADAEAPALEAAAAGDDDNEGDEGRTNPPVPSISISSGTVSKDDKEYPFALFRGMVESKVICAACKTSSATLDPIEDVGLEVSLDRPSTADGTSTSTRSTRNASPLLLSHAGTGGLADVKSAFERFAREEMVDGYKCEKCGCTGPATKQSKLASIPPILTLHLKRFRYGSAGTGTATNASSFGSSYLGAGTYVAPTVTTRSSRSGRSEVNQLSGQDFALGGKSGSAKIEGHVKFDLAFDLKPYLTDQMKTPPTKPTFCRLFAVIVHAGKNSHSGHYIAYVQSLNKNEWWKMDDGRVTLVDKNDVLRAEAYMLFYRVLQHPVAAALSGAYDRQLATQLDAAAAPAPVQPLAGPASTGRPSNGRAAKRTRTSPYNDGEEWARAKAPRLVGAVTKAQEVIAEALELTSEFLQRMQDEVNQDDARDDAAVDGPKTTVAGEEDVVGGVAVARQRLTDLFYRLAQLYDDGSGTVAPRPKFLEPIVVDEGAAAVPGTTSTSSNYNNDACTTTNNNASTRSPPKTTLAKAAAAVEPSDPSKSSVEVVNLMDSDETELL